MVGGVLNISSYSGLRVPQQYAKTHDSVEEINWPRNVILEDPRRHCTALLAAECRPRGNAWPSVGTHGRPWAREAVSVVCRDKCA